MPKVSHTAEQSKAGLQDDHDPSELAQRQNNASEKQPKRKPGETDQSESGKDGMGFPPGDESKWG